MSMPTRNLILSAFTCLGLHAEAPGPVLGLEAAFKARAAYGLKAEDGLGRKRFGIGFEVGYGTRYGRWGLELGYQYQPGSQHLAALGAMPTANGATVDRAHSVDSRKSQLDGLTGRLCFERPMAAGPFAWRLGVQVGGSRFRQEYIGDVTDNATYEDTYNGTVTKRGGALSPLAGIRYDLDRDQSLEFNVVSLAYASVNYVHVAGSVANVNGGHTVLDYTETRKRTTPHFEFAYVLRF